MRTNLKKLLSEAQTAIESCDVATAKEKVGNHNYLFVDVREKEELETEGQIPGAVHIPRGMLEFHLDPESPYYNNIFDKEKTIIFYCKSGSRSALASHLAVEMGLKDVVNLEGGFVEWQKHQ